MIAAIDPFLFSDWGCCSVAHHFEYYFNFMQATEVGQTSLYCQKKITDKINENPLLHSCPWDSKSVAYIRILNISKFSNHLPLGFNNAHKCRYGIPIRPVNICKVSSLGNQILQINKMSHRNSQQSRICVSFTMMPDVLKSTCLACAETAVVTQRQSLAQQYRLLCEGYSVSQRLWPYSLWTQ